jgi:hypothetical protein
MLLLLLLLWLWPPPPPPLLAALRRPSAAVAAGLGLAAAGSCGSSMLKGDNAAGLRLLPLPLLPLLLCLAGAAC